METFEKHKGLRRPKVMIGMAVVLCLGCAVAVYVMTSRETIQLDNGRDRGGGIILDDRIKITVIVDESVLSYAETKRVFLSVTEPDIVSELEFYKRRPIFGLGGTLRREVFAFGRTYGAWLLSDELPLCLYLLFPSGSPPNVKIQDPDESVAILLGAGPYDPVWKEWAARHNVFVHVTKSDSVEDIAAGIREIRRGLSVHFSKSKKAEAMRR